MEYGAYAYGVSKYGFIKYGVGVQPSVVWSKAVRNTVLREALLANGIFVCRSTRHSSTQQRQPSSTTKDSDRPRNSTQPHVPNNVQTTPPYLVYPPQRSCFHNSHLRRTSAQMNRADASLAATQHRKHNQTHYQIQCYRQHPRPTKPPTLCTLAHTKAPQGAR